MLIQCEIGFISSCIMVLYNTVYGAYSYELHLLLWVTLTVMSYTYQVISFHIVVCKRGIVQVILNACNAD